MNEDNMRVRDDIEVMRKRYAALKKFCHDKKIVIPADLENL